MKPYNFTIDYVCSGAESLDKVKEKHYDIIFMDYMMPNMDGWDTLKAIRNNKKIKYYDTKTAPQTQNNFLNGGAYVQRRITQKTRHLRLKKIVALDGRYSGQQKSQRTGRRNIENSDRRSSA